MSLDVGTRSKRPAEISQVTAAILALGALLISFRDTALAIVDKWSNWAAYNHGFLIVPICLYLAWRQRTEAAATDIKPDFKGIGVVILAVFAWLLGRVTSTLVIQEISLIVAVQGIMLTMYGWPMWRTFKFPFLYLFFAVPLGQELVPRLQAVTAGLAVKLLQLVGIPVFSDGTIISVPNGTFYVADECSGLGFLTASLAIGVLFAGITYRSWWRRGAFMTLSVVIPVVANGVRAFGIILLAYFTNNELATGIDHVLYGWIFFSLITFVTLAIGMSFREKELPGESVTSTAPRADHSKPIRYVALAGLVALTPVAIAAVYATRTDERPIASSIHPVLPQTIGAWRETGSAPDPLPPIFAAPDAQLDASYEKENARIYLHIGYYSHNRQGAQAVSSDHRFGQGKGWILAAEGATKAKIGDEHIAVQYCRSVTKERKHTIWYWYWIDGRFTGNRYLAKLLEAKEKIFGGQDEAAIVVIATDYDENAADADRALSDFASTLDVLRPVLIGHSAPPSAP